MQVDLTALVFIKVALFIDAEESWLQGGIDQITDEMMERREQQVRNTDISNMMDTTLESKIECAAPVTVKVIASNLELEAGE